MEAYTKSTTKKEDKDRRATPPEVVSCIEEVIGMRFDIDVCAEPETAKASRYWTKENDALSFDWHLWAENRAVLFINPPYSAPTQWVRKAATEAKNGLFVVGLLPDDRSTEWYQKWIEGVAPIVYLPKSRISFINPSTGKRDPGNPKGAVIPVWTPFYTTHTVYERIEL